MNIFRILSVIYLSTEMFNQQIWTNMVMSYFKNEIFLPEITFENLVTLELTLWVLTPGTGVHTKHKTILTRYERYICTMCYNISINKMTTKPWMSISEFDLINQSECYRSMVIGMSALVDHFHKIYFKITIKVIISMNNNTSNYSLFWK